MSRQLLQSSARFSGHAARRTLASPLLLALLLTWTGACGQHQEPAEGSPGDRNAGRAGDPPGMATDISEASATPTPDPRQWAPVVRGTVNYSVPTVGSLRARQVSRLSSQVNGRIESVLADVGDHVTEGQELVRIDAALFRIEVAQRESELEAARIGLTDAELTLKRLQGLWSEGSDSAIPRQMLDEAQAKRDGAAAGVHRAEHALNYARQRLEDTVIRAPYAGMITERMVDAGESVATMNVMPLMEIQEIAVLELVLSLPQDSMALVRKGTPLTFRVDGIPGQEFETKVDTVYPTIDESTRSFLARAWVENGGLVLRPGLLAQVSVFAARVEDVLVAPRASLSKTDGGWTVMVKREGAPALQQVEVGLSSMEGVEIRSGLNEGDEVLMLGGQD